MDDCSSFPAVKADWWEPVILIVLCMVILPSEHLARLRKLPGAEKRRGVPSCVSLCGYTLVCTTTARIHTAVYTEVTITVELST